MSDIQKAAAPQKKNEKNTKNKSVKKSLGWIIGVAVLILISITFVIPTTAFSGKQSGALSFGKYDGKSIDLTYDSYFYLQLQNAYNSYVQQYGEEYASYYTYNIYYTAYQNAMLNEAFQVMAKKAGIKPADKEVSDAVIQSGFYSDGTNTYSEELYKNATDQQKSQIVSWMKEAVVMSRVQSDIASAPASTAEVEFISSMSNTNRRDINYIAITGNTYPDEAATEYLYEHPSTFEAITFVRASFPTEEEANEMFTGIAEGTVTMDDAVFRSVDSSAMDGGRLNEVPRYIMENYLGSKEKADELYLAAEGSLVGPILTSEGYSIFLIEVPVHESEPDEETLIAVKSYITQYDSDIMKAYLDSSIVEIGKSAKEDFEATAQNVDVAVSKVYGVVENPGDSEFIASFNYADVHYGTSGTYDGYLYTAVKADPELQSALFHTELGEVTDPFYASGIYIIAQPMESANGSDYTAATLATLYANYVPQISISDLQNTVINSDKVESNFISAFIEAVYGQSN